MVPSGFLVQPREHSDPPASLRILTRGSFLEHLESFRNMISLFSAPTNAYLLLDGFKKVSYISVCGSRRNAFPQFAGPTSRMLRFFPQPNSSRVRMASAKTYALILLRRISFPILSQSSWWHPSAQFIRLNEDILSIRLCQ